MIPVWLPVEVAERCNKLIVDSLNEQGIELDVLPITLAFGPERNEEISESEETEAYLWRINSLNAWQLVDRRIDE